MTSHGDKNMNWIMTFWQKLYGNPEGRTYLERNGYNIPLYFDKVRKTFVLRKPLDAKGPRYYRVQNPQRLRDAVSKGLIGAGEDVEIWSEYQRFYKWQEQHIQEQLVDEGDFPCNGPLFDCEPAGPCCIYEGKIPEWAKDEPVSYLDSKGHKLRNDDEFVKDAWRQCDRWRGQEGQRKAYYFGTMHIEDMSFIREEACQTDTERLLEWIDIASAKLEAIEALLEGEFKTKSERFDTIKELLRMSQVVETLEKVYHDRGTEEIMIHDGDPYFDNRDELNRVNFYSM